MKVLDLFCGTKSIANAFESRGHEVYTVDWNAAFKPSLVADIGTLTAQDIINHCGGIPDVIWASPDCTTYSVCKIGYHRRKEANGNLAPVTDYAKKCDEINAHLIALIEDLSFMAAIKPPCKQGAPCHEAAPRGSQTGTQGLKNKVERAKIPAQLCQHIVDICEEYIKEKERCTLGKI